VVDRGRKIWHHSDSRRSVSCLSTIWKSGECLAISKHMGQVLGGTAFNSIPLKAHHVFEVRIRGLDVISAAEHLKAHPHGHADSKTRSHRRFDVCGYMAWSLEHFLNRGMQGWNRSLPQARLPHPLSPFLANVCPCGMQTSLSPSQHEQHGRRWLAWNHVTPDLVYVDGSTSSSMSILISGTLDLLKENGILFGDDFCCQGVIGACEKFSKSEAWSCEPRPKPLVLVKPPRHEMNALPLLSIVATAATIITTAISICARSCLAPQRGVAESNRPCLGTGRVEWNLSRTAGFPHPRQAVDPSVRAVVVPPILHNICATTQHRRHAVPRKNVGIRRARGEWILSLNADTYLTPEVLARLRPPLHPDTFYLAERVDFDSATLACAPSEYPVADLARRQIVRVDPIALPTPSDLRATSR